jgi:hypothetical protein
MSLTATEAMQAGTINHRDALRELAHENWTVHQLLVLLDTGRIPADQWADFALLTLARHNNVLQAEILKHHMTNVAPLIIQKEEINDA